MEPQIGLAQITVIPSRPDLNTSHIISYIEKARQLSLDVIAFPEMAVPGYLIGDEWENDRFVEDCIACNELIRQASTGLTVIWGSIDSDLQVRGEDGRRCKFNTAFIAHNGSWVSNGVQTGRSYKTLLPNYREFDDKRYFMSMEQWARQSGTSIEQTLKPFTVPLANGNTLQIGLMLCEDMWDADYAIKPGRILAANGAEVLINLSCSPWTWRKNDKRHRVARELVASGNIPLYYVNTVGVQNNGKDLYAFDGASTIYGDDGSIGAIAPAFSETIIRSGDIETASLNVSTADHERDNAETFRTLIEVLRRWFAAMPNQRVAIGLSGGIDSALVATLLAIAVGPNNVWAVNMPSRFNSGTTRNAARQLADNLGINYAIMPIQDSYDATVTQIEETIWNNGTKLTLSGLNRENIQARDRGGRILAAVASAIGGVFTNNGNKTEIGFGYATLYGDVNGAIAPIGDLYKTQVYALSTFINKLYAQGELATWMVAGSSKLSVPKDDTLIPRAIIEVVPSAELSENQNVDEGKGDPIRYEYHDRILYQFVDGGHQPNYDPGWGRRDPYDLLRWYLDGDIDGRLEIPVGTTARYCPDLQSFIKDLEEKWTWYKRATFKRIQSPPIIALSKRAFGFDLRESINGVYFSLPYRQLRDSVLPKH